MSKKKPASGARPQKSTAASLAQFRKWAIGRLREAIRRLNTAIPEEASACAVHADKRATGKRYLQVQTERRLNL